MIGFLSNFSKLLFFLRFAASAVVIMKSTPVDLIQRKSAKLEFFLCKRLNVSEKWIVNLQYHIFYKNILFF